MDLSKFVKYPKAQSYEVINIVIMILVGAGICATIELVTLETMFQPVSQILSEIGLAQQQASNVNGTAQTALQNATQQLWPTVLTNQNLSNRVAILTLISITIFFATPMILSFFLSQQEPTRIASPKYMQYVAYGILFVAVVIIGRFESLPVLLLMALFSPFLGKGQDAVLTSFTGYSGSMFDMTGRSVKVNASLDSVIEIFKLERYRKRFGNISAPERVEDGLWRASNSSRQFAYYVEFKHDLSGEKTIINIIMFKKSDYAIQTDADVKEMIRMRIAYLKDFMGTDHAIEVFDAPSLLAAGLAQYAYNDIRGISKKFEKLGQLELWKNAAFGGIVVIASLYLLYTNHVVEGISILVPGFGYIIYDLQKKIRD